MNPAKRRSLVSGAGAVLCLLILAACAVPLAPGYRIFKESIDAKFLTGSEPRLAIRCHYTLENIGNAELTFLDAGLPDEQTYGRKNLRISLDGVNVPVSAASGYPVFPAPDVVRVTFGSPWPRRRKRDLLVEYELSAPEDSGARLTIIERSFHLAPRRWLPVLEPPKTFLAPRPRRPDPTAFTIAVPSDFLVVARGALKDKRVAGREVEYHYELRKADLEPYVVAGRYVSSPANPGSAFALFWTYQPLPGDPSAGEARIAAAWNTLASAFGPLDKDLSQPLVVESTALRPSLVHTDPAAVEPFPGGAIVNPAALAIGVGSDLFVERLTHAFAHSWFGEQIRFTSDATIGLGEGLADYATIVVEEANGGEAVRRARAIELLRRYDDARKLAVEIPLAFAKVTDPPEQQAISRAKAPLLFLALEDAYGEQGVRHGLARLVSVLRGQQVGYDDLVAAIQIDIRKNPAELVRVWLNNRGIPAEFRAKYESGERGNP